MKIPLSKPDITDLEIDAVNRVLSTPHLSMGPAVTQFEKMLSDFLGVKYAVAVSSGTAALHLAMTALGANEEDEIITSPFSFIASANCILYAGATPRFIDIDEETYNIDTEKISEFLYRECRTSEKNGHIVHKQTGKQIRFILPVHIFGNACDMASILEDARQYQLTIVEDACEAIGTDYFGKKVGSIGKAGVFAFYPNKQITTAEGGALVTNDYSLMRHCKSCRNQGRNDSNKWLVHERLGYNYRLSDIHCALGTAQLQRIDEILDKRKRVAERYNQNFNGIEGVQTPYSPDRGEKSWFVYVIQLSKRYTVDDRDEVMNGLLSKRIACNNYFSPIHLQPFYRRMFGYKKGDFPTTESASHRCIALPFFNDMSEEQVDTVTTHVIDELHKIDRRHKIILDKLKTSCDLGVSSVRLAGL